MSIQLVCTADLHLGKQVGPPSQKSCVIEAWQALVEACLQIHPDVLLIAGDVIDSDTLFFEMYGILRKGIFELCQAGISVIAVAGNHDSIILEQLNRSLRIPEFHLLGKEGNWERLTLSLKGRSVHFDGVSFTSSSMQKNPLDFYDLPPPPQEDLHIGLLHCDTGFSNEGKYAPVRPNDFHRFTHDVWILGHIHIPKKLSERPLIRYCGSLQGLDGSETGRRSAWALLIDLNREIKEQPLCIAPLRWETVSIDSSSFCSSLWQEALFESVEKELLQRAEPGVRVFSVRVILKGRTDAFSQICRHLSRLKGQEDFGISFQENWIPCVISSIHNETRPPYSLSSLATGNDFVATLAKKLIALQEDSPLLEALFEKMQKSFSKDSVFKQCEMASLNREECREIALAKGYELLDTLLAQKQI